MVKDFKQKRVDYFDIYICSFARIISIIVLLALANIYNLHVHHMNVKTTSLNDDINKEVYMEQPEGLVLPRNEHKVCKNNGMKSFIL